MKPPQQTKGLFLNRAQVSKERGKRSHSKWDHNPNELTGQGKQLKTQSKEFVPKQKQFSDMLKKEDLKQPSQETIGEIQKIINFVGMKTMVKSVQSLDNLLNKEQYEWFSHYMTVQRVIQDNGKSELYSALIFETKNIPLIELTKQQCFDSLKFFISMGKKQANDEHSKFNTVLKRVCEFLAHLTIVRNKPILASQFDLKQLIYEGRRKNRYTVVTIVVCTVLKQTKNSQVYNPHNPWVLGLVKLLLELYIGFKAELEKDGVYEIQILFKELYPSQNIDSYKETTPGVSSVLKGNITTEAEKQEVAFFEEKINIYPLIDADDFDSINEEEDEYETMEEETGYSHGEFVSQMLNPVDEVRVQMSLKNFPQINQDEFKKMVNNAISKAIQQIISPVIERSVNITLITTRELILKDFMFEKDYEKLEKAANLASESLAGQLAQVTCREPLRQSFKTILVLMIEKHQEEFGIQD